MKKWLKLGLAIGILMGLPTLAGMAFYRLALGLEKIEIVGLTYTMSSEVESVLRPLSHRNALMISAFGLANRRITKSIDKISKVESNFRWPNGLTITIHEKKPWLGLTDTDQTMVISKDGSILTTGEVIPQDSSVIWVRGIQSSIFRDQQRLNPYLLQTLTHISTTIRHFFPNDSFQIELNGLIVGATGVTYKEILLIKDDTVPIYIGTPDLLRAKLSHMKTYFDYYSELPTPNQIEYVDLRRSNRIVVKYVSNV